MIEQLEVQHPAVVPMLIADREGSLAWEFWQERSVHVNGEQLSTEVTELLKEMRHISDWDQDRRDAATDSAVVVTATSLQASGYHRTETELRKRKVETERNYGPCLQ